MERKLITKYVLKTVYLTLQQCGYSNISLKKQDLLEYVPKIQKILEQNKLMDCDLFVKTPVEETYDEFKKFLIKEFFMEGLGYFNQKYDTIILDCTNFYIFKHQELFKYYKKVIYMCCYVISGDNSIFELLNSTNFVKKEEEQSKLTEIINCINYENEHFIEPYICEEKNNDYSNDYKRSKQK